MKQPIKALLLYGPFTATIECANPPDNYYRVMIPVEPFAKVVDKLDKPEITFRSLEFELIYVGHRLAVYEFCKES